MHVWAYKEEIMSNDLTAIFLHMDMFALQDGEAWQPLLDATCVGEDRREWEDETRLYNIGK